MKFSHFLPCNLEDRLVDPLLQGPVNVPLAHRTNTTMTPSDSFSPAVAFQLMLAKKPDLQRNIIGTFNTNNANMDSAISSQKSYVLSNLISNHLRETNYQGETKQGPVAAEIRIPSTLRNTLSIAQDLRGRVIGSTILPLSPEGTAISNKETSVNLLINELPSKFKDTLISNIPVRLLMTQDSIPPSTVQLRHEIDNRACNMLFPCKLHRLLLDLEKEKGGTKIASFLPCGQAFAIHRPRDFVKIVMPKYFRMGSFPSFQRQLNLYNFSRITHGPEEGAYYHEFFIRDLPMLCERIRRRPKNSMVIPNISK